MQYQIKFIKDTKKFKKGEIAKASKKSAESYIKNKYAEWFKNPNKLINKGKKYLFFDGGIVFGKDKKGGKICGAYCLFDSDGNLSEKDFLIQNDKTNNEGEYSGLILGLKRIKELKIKEIQIFGDSEIVINQINGEYDVNSDNLKPLYSEVKTLLKGIKFKINWIDRDTNVYADYLTTITLDKYRKSKKRIPKENKVLEKTKNFIKSFQNKKLIKPKDKEKAKIETKVFREEKKKKVLRDEEEDEIGIIRQWDEKEKQMIPKYETPKIELTNKFSPKPFADELMKFHSFRFDNFSRFWIYDKDTGLWKEDAEQFVKSHLRKYLFGETNQKEHYANEVVNYIKSMSWTREIPEDLDKNIIAFKNCLANIKTGEIIPFNEDYFITSKVMVELNPQYKECFKIDEFFEEVIGKKEKSILYDLMSYCFYRGYPNQKIFILHGPGENGKTTYLDLLTYILGEQNISSETPQELSSKDFSKGSLWKKFANISSELPYTALNNTNTIKGLCGGDLIKCNRKFKEPFQFRNYAKLIFAGNELPATNDKTYAFARRLYIIKFGKKIKDPIKNYVDKLLNQDELSGLAWKCFQKLRLMKERGWNFEIEVDAEEMLRLYEELSNPLSKFLKEEVIEDGESYIFKYVFKEEFEAWCKNKGFRIWSDNELGRAMKHRFDESKKSIWIEGNQKRYRAWLGIKWRSKQNVQDVP